MKKLILKSSGALTLLLVAMMFSFSAKSLTATLNFNGIGRVMNSFDTIQFHFIDPLPAGAVITGVRFKTTFNWINVAPPAPNDYLSHEHTMNGTYVVVKDIYQTTGPGIYSGTSITTMGFTPLVYNVAASNMYSLRNVFANVNLSDVQIEIDYTVACNLNIRPVITSTSSSSISSVSLNWTDVNATGYQVECRSKGTSIPSFQTIDVSGSTFTHTFTGLVEGATYEVRVRGFCTTNEPGNRTSWSPKSEELRTLGVQRCPEVTNFIAQGVTSSSVNFSFDYDFLKVIEVKADVRTSSNSHQASIIFPCSTYSVIPGKAVFLAVGLPASTLVYIKLTSICNGGSDISLGSAFLAARTIAGPMTGPGQSKIFNPQINPSSGVISNIYPNPTRDILNLEVATISDNAIATIMAIDGKVMKVVSLNNNMKSEINVSDLSNGMYMIRIQNGSDVSTQRFVKQ